MAKIAILTDTNTLLASISIPDTAIPHLKRAFGGVTNQEVAAAILAWFKPTLRAETIARNLANRRSADSAAIEPGQVAEVATHELDWPEV